MEFFLCFRGALYTRRFSNIVDIYTSLSSTQDPYSAQEIRCVRDMWASKYGILDMALKISQNAWTFAPSPDTVPRKSQLWTYAS